MADKKRIEGLESGLKTIRTWAKVHWEGWDKLSPDAQREVMDNWDLVGSAVAPGKKQIRIISMAITLTAAASTNYHSVKNATT